MTEGHLVELTDMHTVPRRDHGEVVEDDVKDSPQGDTDQESSSRMLGHTIKLATEDHIAGQTVEKTGLSGEASMRCMRCGFTTKG